MKMISKQGLPLKITAEWTDNDYWNRIHEDYDDMECINVAGWLIRINGKKYPRGHYGDDGLDWTYRYTTKDRDQAIKNALQEARLSC